MKILTTVKMKAFVAAPAGEECGWRRKSAKESIHWILQNLWKKIWRSINLHDPLKTFPPLKMRSQEGFSGKFLKPMILIICF